MKLTPLILGLASVALLAGCTTTSPAPSDGDTSSSSEAADASATADISVYYPVALGNEWDYRITYPEPLGVVTETDTMTAVTPDGDGQRVTIERSFHYENGSQPDFADSVDYVFHDDGSLTVPFQSIPSDLSGGGAVVTILSGAMVWPTAAEFEAGTPKTGTIETSVEASGMTIPQNVAFTITGQGLEDVTVPAGTFTARKMLQAMLISLPSYGMADLPINATVWLAEGVGPVRTEVPGLLGDSTITTELLEFRPAK